MTNRKLIGGDPVTSAPDPEHGAFRVNATPPDWPRNRLLLALPATNLKRLMPQLERVPCQSGQILQDADSSLDDVFFPDSGVVSVVAVYSDGDTIEMATVGRSAITLRALGFPRLATPGAVLATTRHRLEKGVWACRLWHQCELRAVLAFTPLDLRFIA